MVYTKLLVTRIVDPTPERASASLDPSIVYPDLVATLKRDPTKYRAPRVDGQYRIVENSVFFRAAKDAGLQEMLVECDVGVDDVPVSPGDWSINRYIFFEKQIKLSSELDAAFSEYFDSCRQALTHPFNNRGEVNTARYDVVPPNMLQVLVKLKLMSPESMLFLKAPTNQFYRKLAITLGVIRSIDGFRYNTRGRDVTVTSPSR